MQRVGSVLSASALRTPNKISKSRNAPGVRHLRRAVQSQSLIEAPMSRMILSGELTDWPEVEVVVCNGQIVLQRKEELALAEASRAYCLSRAANSAPWKLELPGS